MEEKEFEQIALRVRPRILSVSRRFFTSVRMEDEIEDVVQEVLIQLWRKRFSLNQINNLESWITTVTMNLCVSKYRESRKMSFHSIDGYEFVSNESTSEAIEEEENRELVLKLLNKLPESTRKILYMKNTEGMSLDEIAAICDRPKTSIKSSITTAKKQILEILKKQL